MRDDIVAEPGDGQRPTQFAPGIKQWHAQSSNSNSDVLVGDTEATVAGEHGICFNLVCCYEGMRGEFLQRGRRSYMPSKRLIPGQDGT